MIPVPAIWSGRTVVILANGPSLTREDVARCAGLPTLAIKDTWELAPWAEVLYGCDKKWWQAHPETQAFAGLKYALEQPRGRTDVTVLQRGDESGLATDPSTVNTGYNSGYQALNLIRHLGATRALLLGYDMQPTGGQHHWFGMHRYNKQPPDYAKFRRLMQSIVAPLQLAGIEVLNCSRQTALTCFSRVSLEDALAREAVAA